MTIIDHPIYPQLSERTREQLRHWSSAEPHACLCGRDPHEFTCPFDGVDRSRETAFSIADLVAELANRLNISISAAEYLVGHYGVKTLAESTDGQLLELAREADGHRRCEALTCTGR